jgi:mannosyl-oligosaccharide alpha-1,2-mannosidase
MSSSSSSTTQSRKVKSSKEQQNEEEPVQAYVGGPLKASSKMSSLQLMIILFSCLIISSVIFMYLHTSSLEHEGVRISHEPIINPLAEEDARLHQQLNELMRNQQQQNNEQGQQQFTPPKPVQKPSSTTSSTTTTSVSTSSELKTVDDYKSSFDSDDSENKKRRLAVREAMKFAYGNYERYAMGRDELKPVSGSYKDWVHGGMAMTVVDSLDTLFIMGLKDEFSRARDYIANKLPRFNSIPSTVSVFETNIRMLGGFLSAYDLSQDDVFLKKAKEIGDILAGAFDEGTGMFAKSVNLQNGHGQGLSSIVLSEVGTMQLEFRRLSLLTGDNKYDRMATRVMTELKNAGPSDGLFPVTYMPHSKRFAGVVTMGGLGDSFFEYLLKQWLLTGKTDNMYLEMYQRSLHGIITKMVDNFDSNSPPVSFIAEYSGGRKIPRVGHLACFAAGMLALGEANGVSERAPAAIKVDTKEVMKVAEQFTTACVRSYQMTTTGIGPEGWQYSPTGHISGSGYYILRPETVESLFILFRITGNKKYQDWAWELFSNIEKNCKVKYGYSGLHNVYEPGSYNDVQESFFLAETLKYFYLVFSPSNVIPLDKWVFNTEAHPLRISQK